jgi:hypothetical protein
VECRQSTVRELDDQDAEVLADLSIVAGGGEWTGVGAEAINKARLAGSALAPALASTTCLGAVARKVSDTA